MNNNLTSWLANIKSDDIDGGLAADFDGSLSGLGVELGANNTYNMSEALLALPSVYKEENSRSSNNILLHQQDSPSASLFGLYSISNNNTNDGGAGSTRSLTLPLLRTVSFPNSDLAASSPHSLSLPSLSGSQHITGELDSSLVDGDNMNSEWVSLMTSMKLGEVEDCTSTPRFQYILNASTSPATKICEETLTYLNQGQSYEITLKQIKDGSHTEFSLLKSIVRVVFHEKRLQSTEQQQLEAWKMMRPGERILEIDLPLSHGIMDLKVDPNQLNLVEFVWDPDSIETTSVFIKLHCVSSEFTAKKHGGEKGVPFRIRVETYSNNVDEDPVLLHYASCQIKVFKPKGADRKNKTDKEKIERQTESEKGKFQPAFNCTVLTETKEQSVPRKGIPDNSFSSLCLSAQPSSTTTMSQTTATISYQFAPVAMTTIPSTSSNIEHVVHPSTFTDGSAHSDETSFFLAKPQMKPTSLAIQSVNSGSVSRKRPLETSSSLCSPHSPPTFPEVENDTLLPSSTPEDVVRWLTSNRFHDFVETFNNFSGSDLLCLRREDLIQICGIANGIRLHNTLLAKSVQPRLTLYVCQATRSLNNDQPLGLAEIVQYSPVSSKSRSSTSSPVPSSQQIPTSLPVSSNQNQQIQLKLTNDCSSPFVNGIDKSILYEMNPNVQEDQKDVANILGTNSGGKIQAKNQIVSKEVGITTEQTNVQIFSAFTFSTSSTTSTISTSKSGACKIRNRMSQFSPENKKKFDFKLSSSFNGDKAMTSFSEKQENHEDFMTPSVLHVTPSPSSSSTSTTTSAFPSIYSNKRSISDKDEESSHQSLLVFKKQRMQHPEVACREVFHAVYLESLTERHLATKLAGSFSLQADMISQILLKNSVGFFVLVDDKVVQNMRDSSSFIIEATEDEDFTSFCKIILKPVEA